MRWPAEIRNGTRWYRSGAASWFRSAALLASALLLGLVVVLPGPRLERHHLINDRPAGLWILGVALLVAAGVSVLQLRSGIGLSEDGVVVRTAYGISYRAPWADVDHFVLAREHETQPRYQLRPMVIYRAGKPRSTVGCDFGRSGKGRQQARRIVTAMESARVLRQAQHLAVAPSGPQPATS
jgi:hypothetical protein